MTSRVLRRGVAVAGVALLLGTAACGSGDGSGGDGTSSPTSSPTPSPPSVRVPTSAPTVEPADGPLIRTEGATIRGLKKMRLVSDYHVLQGYRNDQAHLTFLPGYAGDASLDRFARLHEKVVEEDDGDVLERVDDVVVGGEYNAFHFLDTSDPKEENHTYGLVFLNGSWTIHIGFYNESIGDVQPLTPEEREQATASILASFEPTFAG